MPSVGVVALSPSFKAPLTTKWIANEDEDTWITIENRCALPLDVTPSFADGSQDLVYGFTVPAMYRVTVPILPDRGVQLSCMQPTPTNGNTAPFNVGLPFGFATVSNASGNLAGRYCGKNNVPYMLHSNGGAPSEPLYPVESCIQSAQSFSLLASQTAVHWISYNQIGSASTNLDFAGPVDACLVAQTFQVISCNFTGTNEIAVVQYIYDRDSAFPNPDLEGGTIFYTQGQPFGVATTVEARGAVGYALGIAGGSGTDTLSVNVIDWIGSPGA